MQFITFRNRNLYYNVTVRWRYTSYIIYIQAFINIKGYPFRCFKNMRLQFGICQTKLWNQFFSFQLSPTLMKMYRLTMTQSTGIVKTYTKNGDSATATYLAFRGDYGLYNRPRLCKQDWSGYKYWKACGSSFRSFRWKYRYCKLKVLPKTRMCRFLVVRRNYDCLTACYCVFFI